MDNEINSRADDVKMQLRNVTASYTSNVMDLQRNWLDALGQFTCRELQTIQDGEMGEQIQQVHRMLDEVCRINDYCGKTEELLSGADAGNMGRFGASFGMGSAEAPREDDAYGASGFSAAGGIQPTVQAAEETYEAETGEKTLSKRLIR